MSKWNEEEAKWEPTWSEAEHLRNPLETNAEASIWNQVIFDIRQREQTGVLRYGKYLTKHTTEDVLNHAYNEALDLVVYLRTEIIKRNSGYNPNL